MGSLFAGIGGFDLGFERAGFTVAWHAEIDKAASRILAYHWPTVPNLGDVTKIDGASIESVDVICGGFPCQDLSVAGKRAGFTGKRSVLAFEFLRIVAEMRSATNGSASTFVVLENVPGLFSSSNGRDFAALLDALAELRPLDIAWRVLDSRYFNVAQRRERVFVVVDFGGERCDEILALTEGLRGDSPKGRAAGQDVAGTLGGGAQSRGWCDDLDRAGAFVTAATLSTRYGAQSGQDIGQPGMLVAHTLRADGFDASEDGTGRGVPLVCDTMRSHPRPGSNSTGLVIPFDTTQVTQPQYRGRCLPGDPCHTLASAAHAPAIAFNWQNGGGYGEAHDGLAVSEEHTPPMSRSQVAAVAFQVLQQNTGRGGNRQVLGMDEPHPTMNQRRPNALASSSGVRRLTPRECERLQGFPDDWTGIPGMADGPRYKCLGNAVTVNVAEWLAGRIPAPSSPARDEKGEEK